MNRVRLGCHSLGWKRLNQLVQFVQDHAGHDSRAIEGRPLSHFVTAPPQGELFAGVRYHPQ